MDTIKILEFIKYLNLNKRNAAHIPQEYLHVTNSVNPFSPTGKVLDLTMDIDFSGEIFSKCIPLMGFLSTVEYTSPNYAGTSVQAIENLCVFDSIEVCSKFLSLLFSPTSQCIRNLSSLSLFWVGTEKLESNLLSDTGKNKNRKITAFQRSLLEGNTITNFVKSTMINDDRIPVSFFAVSFTSNQEIGFLCTSATDGKAVGNLEQTYSMSTRISHYHNTESMSAQKG